MARIKLNVMDDNGEKIGERYVELGEDTWLPSGAAYVEVAKIEPGEL